MFNPVTDVAWSSLFPIRVAGVSMTGGAPDGLPADPDGMANPVCICSNSTETFIGLEVDFWDIGYLVEAVKDTYCSPTLGKSLNNANNNGAANGGGLARLLGSMAYGTTEQKSKHPQTYMQTHWVVFPALQLMGMLMDSKCLQQDGGFAYAYFSELSPIYSSDALADLTDPKVYLVANPIADFAAIPSYVMAQFPNGLIPTVYDAFYWAWFDSIYPLTGRTQRPHTLTAAAQMAARQVYSFTQDGALLDYTKNVCAGTSIPIARKSQWRFQIAKPVKGATAVIAGQSEIFWGTLKNPAYVDGNFLWVLFQKKRCCQKIKGSDASSDYD